MEKSWGYCKNNWKPEARGLNPKPENTRKLLTPWNIHQQDLIQKPPYLQWNQALPKSQQVSEQDIHTKLILQQHRNITLSIKMQAAKSHTKPIDTSQLTTGHFIALHREEIQLHPPEHQRKLP